MKLRRWTVGIPFVVVLAACSTRPTALPPAPAPSATPAATATRPPAPTATLVAGAVRVTPVATAPYGSGDTRLSPTGRYLAYLSFDPAAAAAAERRFWEPITGTLHVVDLASGRRCATPIRAGIYDGLGWLDDAHMVVSTDGTRLGGASCGGALAPVTPPPGPSPTPEGRSPGGGFRVQTTVDDKTDRARTALYAAGGDAPVATAEWQWIDYVDGSIEPEWVGEGEYLIRESGDRGPLLLSAKRGVVEVGPGLFDVPQRRELRATPLGGPDGPSVIALEIGGSENVRLRLHHLAAGRAEVLPLDHLLDVSPDGQWLAAWGGADLDHQDHPAWIRRLDDIEGDWVSLDGPPEGWRGLRWSPDSTRLAMGGPGYITVFAVPDGRRLGTWDTRPFGGVSDPNAYTRPRQWADDGRTLLTRGAAGDDQGLFVIDVPVVEP